MQSEPFFVAFSQIFPEDTCAEVLSALRQDPLIWNALKSPEFFASASAYAGSHPELWNPGTLSLLCLEKNLELQNLRSFPLLPLEPELRQLAARSYEETLRTFQVPATLADAGLLALALRERRRLTDTWQGLKNELQIKGSPDPELRFRIWKTPLACLYAMAPDPIDLLQALAPTSSSAQFQAELEILLHAVFSNPLTLENQASLLFPLVFCVPSSDQMAWLEAIQRMGRTQLVAELSKRLLTQPPTPPQSKRLSPKGSKTSSQVTNQVANDHQEIANVFQDVLGLRRMAAFHLFSGQTDQAICLLTQSFDTLQEIQAHTLLQIAEAAGQAKKMDTAIAAAEKAYQLDPDSLEIILRYSAELTKAGKFADADLILANPGQNPNILTAKAFLRFSNGDRQAAQEYARQAFQSSEALPNDQLSKGWVRPEAAISTFLSLGLSEETSSLAEAVLCDRPVDYQALIALSQSQEISGQPEKALESAQLAVMLQPKNQQLRRGLADLLEKNGDWERALGERSKVIQANPSTVQPDLLAFARCAIKAGKELLAESTCKTLLENNPEDALAHTYIGQALYQKGEAERAMEHFTQATLLAPEESLPWLSLAQAFESRGESFKAFETLRAAVLSSPQSAEIQFALGEACLTNGSPTEALPALRKAANLDPRSPLYAIRLGDILRDLGHISESKQVLERARAYNPNHGDLAYTHCKTLVANGEKQAAIPALLITLDTQPKYVEPYLIYARLVADTRTKGDRLLNRSQGSPAVPVAAKSIRNEISSHDVLTKALEIDPDNIEARILLAENYETTQKFSDALQIYQTISENKRLDPAFNCRIKMGLGRSALALKQNEIALAALQEAATDQPDDLSIQQTMAEAYFAADLHHESLQAAQNAQRIAPQELENLVWFAGLAFNLGAFAETALVLERAIDLYPDALDLYLNLIQIQITNNNTGQAKETLEKLLANEPNQPEIYLGIAYSWVALGDLVAANQAIKRAIQLTPEPSAELWSKLSQFQSWNGEHEAALQSIQTAIVIEAGRPAFFIGQAEILEKLGREQAALACLEQALQLSNEEASGAIFPVETVGETWGLVLPNVPAPRFTHFQADPASIHMRLSRLLRSLGDLPAALTHAEKSVELAQDSLKSLANAAEIALALLEYETVRKFTQSWEHSTPEFKLDEGDLPTALRLLALEAELEIETGDLKAATRLIELANGLSSKDPYAMAIQARLAGLTGDLAAGEQLLEGTINLLNRSRDGSHPSASYPFYPDTFVDRPKPEKNATGLAVEYPTLTIAEAGLALFQWEGSLALFDQAVRNAPMEPRSHLNLARALVKCAEYQSICAELSVNLHAPGTDKVSDQAYQAFEREIMTANRLTNSPEVARWHKRGQAAFNPTQQSMKLLSGMPSMPEDAAALIAVCRKLGEIQNASDVARLYPESPMVLLQQALTLKDYQPAEGFFCARTLVGFQPNNPIFQACLAILAQNAQEFTIAFEAIQNALQIWSNEACWQMFAADLCDICGDAASAIVHMEKAYALEPENPLFALTLGKAHLTQRHYEKANEYLECVTRLNPNDTAGWLALAEAQRQSGNLAKAITSAEKAISISPNQVKPLVISGEIALQAGQLDLAYHHAQTALRLDASEGRALLLLIRCLSLQGHQADALTALDLALPSVANPLPLQLERVSLVRQLHGPQTTLDALRELAEEYPSDPTVLALLAEELANAGQRENAEKAAQAALQAEPNQPYLHLLVGRLQRNAGQLDQAIHHLSLAVQQNPEEMDAYLELGKAYQERRDHVQALSVYKKAIQVKSQDPRPYYQAGLALKDSKDYPGSEVMLRHAVELAPEDVNIRRQLGAIIAINLVHNSQEASV